MTGGEGLTFHYSIKKDRWSQGPTSIQSRAKHSGCSLGDYIYVSCGVDPDQKLILNDIERFNARLYLAGHKKIEWESIVTNNFGNFQPRYNHVMTPLNDK